MRRIRRSAEGSPDEKWSGARSASCDNSLCAPSSPHHQDACRKDSYHPQKHEYSSSADQLAFIFFHLSEYLSFCSFAPEPAVVLQFDVAAAKLLTA